MSMRGPDRVVLYARTGCHLCEDAREVVGQVAGETGAGWHEVDIDTAPDSEALVRRYGELVPVVTVDGVQHDYWHVDPARLRQALAGGRG